MTVVTKFHINPFNGLGGVAVTQYGHQLAKKTKLNGTLPKMVQPENLRFMHIYL